MENNPRLEDNPTQALADKRGEAAETLRAHPEILEFGVERVWSWLSYYRHNPSRDEFDIEYKDSVSVGLCASYASGHDLVCPDTEPGHVLLGVNGSTGRRLSNILLKADEAKQLAKLLDAAAKKVAR